MIWVTWRQFRVPALAAIAVLVVAAIVLVPTGVHLHHLYGTYKTQLAACNAAGGGCGTLTNTFTAHYHHLFQYLGTILVAVPGVIGIFWGPPLIARELETGSHRLAWTQSVSRTRWLAVKLGLVGAAAMLTAGLLSLMVTWWAAPVDHVTMDRFSAEIFSERGITPIGYAAFAFVLGATLGLLIRRTLPAMAITLVAFFAARQAVIGWLRPHLVPAAHLSLPLSASSNIGFTSASSGGTMFFANSPQLPNVLVVSSHLVDTAGHPATANALQQFIQVACPDIAAPPSLGGSGEAQGSPTAFSACVAHLSARYHEAVAYIPASRYWALQGAETAVYLVVAALLVGVCFWWVRHKIK